MSGRAAYLDTSAFVKLVVAEPESEALRAELRRWRDRASATLLRTEAVRALRRSGNTHLIGKARRLFTALQLIRLEEPVLDRAADLEPGELRWLDAVHLAAALTLGSDLGVVVCYDDRLARAAIHQGLEVASPGW